MTALAAATLYNKVFYTGLCFNLHRILLYTVHLYVCCTFMLNARYLLWFTFILHFLLMIPGHKSDKPGQKDCEACHIGSFCG